MRRLRLRWLGLLAGICCLWAALAFLQSGSAWAGFDEGVAAWERSDYAAALREFRPLAEQGNAVAQFGLGLMYAHGLGVPQDHREAVKWYRLAADQGDAGAQFGLGWMYAEGLGVSQDNREAAKWYRRAAEQGFAAAQVNLGWMYGNGRGIPQDFVQAHLWFNLAATQGVDNGKKGRALVGLDR